MEHTPEVVEIETMQIFQNEPNKEELNEEQNNEVEVCLNNNPKTPMYVAKNHPENQIIGDKRKDTLTRSKAREEICLISQIEPKNTEEACRDNYWIKAMKEELEQIERNNTWELVPRPKNKNVIGTKWVFKNKLNEDGIVVRNKARLVCKDYSQ